MAKIKSKITKQEIIRWIAVLPISVIALLIYGEISSWINKAYLVNFHGSGDSYFTSYIDCIFIPALVLFCGYFISPRLKFISALILSLFYVLTSTYALLTNEYVSNRFNPFIFVYLIVFCLGLYIIYRIENKK